MPTRISIAFEGGPSVQAELNDLPCAAAIVAALPIESIANTWGDEIYFSIGLATKASAAARSDMAVGEIGYWPPGRAFCIFFGPTPASAPGGPPRAASDVEPIGRVIGPTDLLRSVAAGRKVKLTGGE